VGWGDPLYQARHLDLTVYRGLHWYFRVHYGVHEGRRVVFVQHYRLAPENPIEPAE
jgi:hypothetical protein